MRRIGRYIFNGLAVLSLLIFLAMGVLWGRMKPGSDYLGYCSGHTCYQISASDVGIAYSWYQEGAGYGWHCGHSIYGEVGNGFLYQPLHWSPGFVVGLPYWVILLVTAPMPAAWLTMRLRRKRRRRGHCPKCGYDIRVTPYRCPECGHVPSAAERNTD